MGSDLPSRIPCLAAFTTGAELAAILSARLTAAETTSDLGKILFTRPRACSSVPEIVSPVRISSIAYVVTYQLSHFLGR